jgi:hypothetical protein
MRHGEGLECCVVISECYNTKVAGTIAGPAFNLCAIEMMDGAGRQKSIAFLWFQCMNGGHEESGNLRNSGGD